MLIPPPWDSGRGHKGMVQSGARGGSEWKQGRIPLLAEWSNTGTVFLERRSMPHTDTVLSYLYMLVFMPFYLFFLNEIVSSEAQCSTADTSTS